MVGREPLEGAGKILGVVHSPRHAVAGSSEAVRVGGALGAAVCVADSPAIGVGVVSVRKVPGRWLGRGRRRWEQAIQPLCIWRFREETTRLSDGRKVTDIYLIGVEVIKPSATPGGTAPEDVSRVLWLV